MKKAVVLVCSVLLLFLAMSFYFLYRNGEVHSFRTKVIDICCDYNNYNIPDKKIKDAYLVYHNMPTYDEMLFSFKPLKIETYVDKKIAEELQRPYEDNLKNLK